MRKLFHSNQNIMFKRKEKESKRKERKNGVNSETQKETSSTIPPNKLLATTDSIEKTKRSTKETKIVNIGPYFRGQSYKCRKQ
jgi:hypothetical protein